MCETFKRILLSFILAFLLSPQISLAAEVKGDFLDLHGDGNATLVELRFPYFIGEKEDKLSLIYQGGYKIYTIASQPNDVAALGLLQPCIGIVVTDGVKVIAFHKHAFNSLKFIEFIIANNLNLSDTSNLFASIYTAQDNVEWKEGKRQLMHAGNSHAQEVDRIRDSLKNRGFICTNIVADMYNVRDDKQEWKYSEEFLGRYKFSQLCVGVRINDLFQEINGAKQIKFCSIDPFLAEDIFHYKGTLITQWEYQGKIIPSSEERKKLGDEANIPYDKMPPLSGFGYKIVGYPLQGDICLRRMKIEQDELSMKALKKTLSSLLDLKDAYDTFPVFLIP